MKPSLDYIIRLHQKKGEGGTREITQSVRVFATQHKDLSTWGYSGLHKDPYGFTMLVLSALGSVGPANVMAGRGLSV